jgi:hypothetical protein
LVEIRFAAESVSAAPTPSNRWYALVASTSIVGREELASSTRASGGWLARSLVLSPVVTKLFTHLAELAVVVVVLVGAATVVDVLVVVPPPAAGVHAPSSSKPRTARLTIQSR